MGKRKLELNTYAIVHNSVEEWVGYGIRQYYKHRDEPEVKDVEALKEAIVSGIMLGLDEVIDWGDDES